VQKACAPDRVRQQPEIFCASLTMWMSRSAWLFEQALADVNLSKQEWAPSGAPPPRALYGTIHLPAYPQRCPPERPITCPSGSTM
jgi:hypothetical protein